VSNFVIVDIRPTARRPVVNSQPSFCSLTEYHDSARKIIAKYANNYRSGLSAEMLSSEDAISDVASEMMRADWCFEEGRGTTRNSFRVGRAIYAIRDYLDAKLSSKNVERQSLDFEMNDPSGRTSGVGSGYQTLSYVRREMQDEQKEAAIEHCQFLLRISNLSVIQRKCIQKYYLEDMTLEAISRKLKISIQAVQQAIERGLRHLRLISKVPAHYQRNRRAS